MERKAFADVPFRSFVVAICNWMVQPFFGRWATCIISKFKIINYVLVLLTSFTFSFLFAPHRTCPTPNGILEENVLQQVQDEGA